MGLVSIIDLVVRMMSSTVQSALVDVSDRLSIVEGIGAQNPEPVVARFGFDLLFINRKMMVPLNFQIATVTLVSDQTLVPLAKLLL